MNCCNKRVETAAQLVNASERSNKPEQTSLSAPKKSPNLHCCCLFLYQYPVRGGKKKEAFCSRDNIQSKRRRVNMGGGENISPLKTRLNATDDASTGPKHPANLIVSNIAVFSFRRTSQFQHGDVTRSSQFGFKYSQKQHWCYFWYFSKFLNCTNKPESRTRRDQFISTNEQLLYVSGSSDPAGGRRSNHKRKKKFTGTIKLKSRLFSLRLNLIFVPLPSYFLTIFGFLMVQNEDRETEKIQPCPARRCFSRPSVTNGSCGGSRAKASGKKRIWGSEVNICRLSRMKTCRRDRNL